MKSTRREITSRRLLRVIEEHSTLYTQVSTLEVLNNVPLPELSDDWVVPELTIEEKDELHEVLTSENLTPHVTTTLTVDESEKFLLETESTLQGLDRAGLWKQPLV